MWEQVPKLQKTESNWKREDRNAGGVRWGTEDIALREIGYWSLNITSMAEKTVAVPTDTRDSR